LPGLSFEAPGPQQTCRPDQGGGSRNEDERDREVLDYRPDTSPDGGEDAHVVSDDGELSEGRQKKNGDADVHSYRTGPEPKRQEADGRQDDKESDPIQCQADVEAPGFVEERLPTG